MDLHLEDDQAEYLRSLLVQSLGELRMEISDTDNVEYKRLLKRDEVTLRAIIDGLGGLGGLG